MSYLSFIFDVVDVLAPILLSDIFLVFSCMAFLVAVICILVRVCNEFIRTS